MPNRFRIYHTLEDADDGADLIVPATNYKTVHCPRCSQRQISDGWDACMSCGWYLDDDGRVCPACDYRNPTSRDVCEHCRRTLPIQ